MTDATNSTEQGIPAWAKEKNPFEAEDKELEEALGQIWEIAEDFGLDPFPTNFDVVPSRIMAQIAAYGGMADRYPHWTHGRDYWRTKSMYDHGLSKIYELVINSNAAQAYLMENNPPIDNKFVMAHVLGHTDFFKNNMMFEKTRRDMPEATARNAERIEEYGRRIGKLVVEQTLDDALVIEHNINPYQPHRPSREDEIAMWKQQAEDERKRAKAKAKQDNRLDQPIDKTQQEDSSRLHIPPKPDPDLLGFIRNHAPYLENWQRDVLSIVRDESEYFYPQMRTKIMNEGWAAYWHKRIMREMSDRGNITAAEDEKWWKLHSGVVQPSKQQLNPYYLGMIIYEYIEDYYNGNLSEKETKWLEKEGYPTYPRFDGPLRESPAHDKLREVMMTNDDQSFIRNFFDKNVADRMHMYVWEEHETFLGVKVQVVKDTGWEEIRDYLAESMVNCGQPSIVIVDGDYDNANQLYLRHEFDGRPLDQSYINRTLRHLFGLWQRPVYLETNDAEGNPLVFMCDEDGISGSAS